ncbi:hypothetical protein NLG97_g2534 [Lecanicillium saksenae]|uniref:Uncharacterized protein n=1 Tax=Lecanicillium saksenae TaxID=468837 RepID=A0ACC1R418_9HYPO|nr:hypothetical protein NLG97_g2534 [Lecanicillium saksenae]
MSVSVVEWPSVEVPSAESLPKSCLGLLIWVRDETVVGNEEKVDPTFEHSPAAPVKSELPSTKVDGDDGNGQGAVEMSVAVQESTVHDKEPSVHDAPSRREEAAEKPTTETIEASLRILDSPSPENIHEHASGRKSTSSVNSAKEKVLKLISKWKIPPDAAQGPEQPLTEVKSSASTWSVSAIAHEPMTPPNGDSSSQKKESMEAPQVENLTPIEETEAVNNTQSHTVAAWLKDTIDVPVRKLVLPKASRSSAQCQSIDPETGNFLPDIYYPETKFQHELDMQSEPGWRRGSVTADMLINRELKARARLVQLVKERLPTQVEVETPAADSESTFPRADCILRPATDDDIAGIAEIINLERQAGRSEDIKPTSAIRDWDIVKIFNRCKKERRPFIVATAGQGSLLDRSKWPAGADREYQEYVEYRNSLSKSQAAIVGFAFAMPRQVAIMEMQDVRVDHSCYVSLFVHPNHRNKKYGSALLDRILMSVSPIHRSLIDFEWKCEEPAEVYEQPASNNAQQYARVIVEYIDAHDQDQRSAARKKLLAKFGFSQAGNLSCSKSESRGGKRYWLDLFIWEFEAQSLENVRKYSKTTQVSTKMLSILRKARLKDKEMRILMLGLDNAGKTTIVKKILNEDVHTVSPTLGFIIKTIDYDGYKLNIWDVGGQKTLRSYWRNYFEKTDALIWVVDSTDRLRIEDCKEELHGLLQEERLAGACLLIFANKTDVDGCMTETEILQGLRLDEIRTHQWHILQCSAMTGKNLKEGLAWVVEDAKKRLFLY